MILFAYAQCLNWVAEGITPPVILLSELWRTVTIVVSTNHTKQGDTANPHGPVDIEDKDAVLRHDLARPLELVMAGSPTLNPTLR